MPNENGSDKVETSNDEQMSNDTKLQVNDEWEGSNDTSRPDAEIQRTNRTRNAEFK
jgi:hypothetical protein